MATLVLTAVGTLVGGPLGGAIGAIAGRTIDGALIGGGGNREGPRLKDLAVTTSSYGTPIPRLHGRMRGAGTIVWATDLVEHKETSGGGKGRPSTTTYSYSISFAVALSSRPITGVARIWADGNLLRGAAGDLKTAGTLRIHTGHGDQAPDPLLAADDADSPAYRGRAYAVFEDLSLGDFGNRIPALTFEIVADDGSVSLADIVEPLPKIVAGSDTALGGLSGYSYDGGALGDALASIDSVYPLACDAGGDSLTVERDGAMAATPILLPEAATAWEEGDFGAGDGRNRQRDPDPSRKPDALRYYDTGRDYQPGVQRTGGQAQAGRSRVIEFPGALSADNARVLADAAAQRAGWRRETMAWRVAELDPAIVPGLTVRAPGVPGLWRVRGWEWRERGVELDLERQPPVAPPTLPGDPGLPALPPDLGPWPTWLRAFALPWDGYGSSDAPMLFAATSAGGPNWNGASLYVEQAGTLAPIGSSSRSRSTIGVTTGALPPSPGLLLEREAAVDIELAADDMALAPAGVTALATGANRLLVGNEVIQFAKAEQLDTRTWRVSGLLRGRGGTEPAAQTVHPVGSRVVLIDDTLTPLDPALVPTSGSPMVAAIGFGDDEPVTATVTDPGAGRKPLCPVHPRKRNLADGSIVLTWTRRARGAWDWPDQIDAPLVEQSESYRVGCGPVDSPFATWMVGEPRLAIAADTAAGLAATHPGAAIWVRQIGSYAVSDALLLTTL